LSYDRKKKRRKPIMVKITLVVDERKYGVFLQKHSTFADDPENPGISGEQHIVGKLWSYVESFHRLRPPRPVGKVRTRKRGWPQNTGKPKKEGKIIYLHIEPRTIEITLEIKGRLYKNIRKIAEKKGMSSTKSFIEKTANEYIDDANEPLGETARRIYEGIFGVPMTLELVKPAKTDKNP
jgi:hypothetical protein